MNRSNYKALLMLLLSLTPLNALPIIHPFWNYLLLRGLHVVIRTTSFPFPTNVGSHYSALTEASIFIDTSLDD